MSTSEGFSQFRRVPVSQGLRNGCLLYTSSLQQGPGKPGALKVVTTNLKAGYLRKNGVPYSEDTTMTEYVDRLTAYGTDWLTVFTIVEDPHYLNQPFITSTHFKREPDRSKWMPTPCEPGSSSK